MNGYNNIGNSEIVNKHYAIIVARRCYYFAIIQFYYYKIYNYNRIALCVAIVAAASITQIRAADGFLPRRGPQSARRTSEPHSTGTPNSRIARGTTDRHVCAAKRYYSVVLLAVFVSVVSVD